MPALFSWPTLTVGMPRFLPLAGMAGACGPGAGQVELLVGTRLSVTVRGARSARGNYWPAPRTAARAAPVVVKTAGRRSGVGRMRCRRRGWWIASGRERALRYRE